MPPGLKYHKQDSAGESSAHPGHSPLELPLKMTSQHPQLHARYRTLSLGDRIYLAGGLHRPVDLLFVLRALASIIYTVVHLLFIDIPFLVWTRFSVNSIHHPISWGIVYSFCMAMSRASSSAAYNAAQLRLVSRIIAWFVPLRMLHLSGYSVKANVRIKVHLETLLQPERKSLSGTRARLGIAENQHQGINPLNPSPEFFASFVPDSKNKGRLANLPEESGALDRDGSYFLRGEWIEALEDPKKCTNAKRSNVVLLYAHGGGHVFCSATFHRQMVTRLLLEFGPGARAFVPDYRLAPEDPFPAAIHDFYAAYLYLTQPRHEAISPCKDGSTSVHHIDPVEPKNIVLGGDSAGAGVIIAFQLYMRDYINPSIVPRMEMPPVAVLISAWTDISTSMPSATSKHSYCYTPSPMGVNPFATQQDFDTFPKFNFARNYLCGDANLVPNERNSLGKDLEWEWYRHLAQHPLVSPVYTADLSGLGASTLLQTGSFDRLADDTRLYAHKLGQASRDPGQRVRLELYRDMVHVHQYFEFLPMADKAMRSIVQFVEDNQQQDVHTQPDTEQLRKVVGTEWIVVDTDGNEKEGHDDTACSLLQLEQCWDPYLKARG